MTEYCNRFFGLLHYSWRHMPLFSFFLWWQGSAVVLLKSCPIATYLLNRLHKAMRLKPMKISKRRRYWCKDFALIYWISSANLIFFIYQSKIFWNPVSLGLMQMLLFHLVSIGTTLLTKQMGFRLGSLRIRNQQSCIDRELVAQSVERRALELDV